MSNVNEILRGYSLGSMTLEETNKALKAEKAGFHLNPHKNNLTPDEIMNKTAGLLDTGTGYLDKVMIDPVKMETVDQINTVLEDGSVNMIATVILAGKFYRVEGRKLVEC